MRSRLSETVDRVTAAAPVPVGAIGAVLLFLFAVQLLGTATSAAAPLLGRVLRRVVVADASVLGLGWLGAYALANGSVVAALGLSLFASDLLTPAQLFLVVAGSRLGAAAIVVFVGAVDWFRQGRATLRESVSLGVLTFLLTHTIYLPVTVVGYVVLARLRGLFGPAVGGWQIGDGVPSVLEPVAVAVTTALGPLPSLLVAVAVLVGSLTLFDRILETVDTATIRRRFFGHLERTWVSFAVGLVVTGATTSVAFSLGVVVPLYNRGYLKRDELIPYVLGANLGTLFDTLLVAVVLGVPAGVAVVAALLGVATAVTLAALLVHGRYSRLIAAVDDRLLADRGAFLAFVLSLVAVPLALVVVPLVVR